MADDNKPLKYARYAIGEIALVVIGILIALQINTWNEEREKNIKLKVYLENLQQNLESDIETLEILKKVNIFKYYGFQYLLDQSNQTTFDYKSDDLIVYRFELNLIWKNPLPSTYEPEFTRQVFLWSARLMDQDLNNSVLNELKSTGMYSYLANVELKAAIDSYYKLADQSLGKTHQTKIEEIREKWETSLGEEGFLTSNVMTMKDPLKLIRGNMKRMYLIKRMARESIWISQSAHELIIEAHELILLIDKEISLE